MVVVDLLGDISWEILPSVPLRGETPRRRGEKTQEKCSMYVCCGGKRLFSSRKRALGGQANLRPNRGPLDFFNFGFRDGRGPAGEEGNRCMGGWLCFAGP